MGAWHLLHPVRLYCYMCVGEAVLGSASRIKELSTVPRIHRWEEMSMYMYMYMYMCTSFFILTPFWGGGCLAMFNGQVCRKCSKTMHFSRSTLFVILEYVLSSALKRAWIDSAPCSPIIPRPTLHFWMNGTIWSSNICSFGMTVLSGKLERY